MLKTNTQTNNFVNSGFFAKGTLISALAALFFLFFFFFFFFFFYNCIVPMGFLPWEIRVAFPGEKQALPLQ